MVTRSIVGRFLILAVLLVSLGVIAQAAIYISSGKKVARADPPPTDKAPSSATAALAAPANAAAPTVTTPAVPADASPIRVVYPGPLGDAPVPRKIADAAPASPLPNQAVPPAAAAGPTPTAPQPAPQTAGVAPSAAKPASVVIASADPTTGTPAAADPASAAKGGVNLNNASVDALNHLGGGHIGQTIVKHRPYTSVEDLVTKRVVRRSVYEQIKNQVAAE